MAEVDSKVSYIIVYELSKIDKIIAESRVDRGGRHQKD